MRLPGRTITMTLVVAAALPSGSGFAQTEPRTGTFKLVGHEPLFNRGMNAALAVHGDYAYVGSRTDGKPADANLTRGGVMIVDVSDPADPVVVNEMAPPDEGNGGESSRELRVWRSQDILIVLHTNCGAGNAHICQTPSSNSFRFYDISGDRATDPVLIRQFDRNTHEFFLWEDPSNPERALMFGGSAGSQMQVWDLSPLLQGEEPVTLFTGPHGYSTGGVHSLSVSNDGGRAYLALLTGGFAVADVSDFAAGVANPQPRRITLNGNRPTWAGPGAHSAVKLWGRDWVYVSDEVYGLATGTAHGCPWGWARMIDISDPTAPTVQAEYRIAENHESFCEPADTRPFSSYSAHNPTQTPNIVLSSWHSGGLQAVDVSDPANPAQLAELRPDPLPFVVTEDPRLSAGQDKVVMWSYPIIKDGLIYVVDLRNGLYILEYDGWLEDQIDDATFLEGNSNQGHALCYEPVGALPEYC
ncbi:MAG: LVIVD repeat-containing protein [Actinomycetota bacterium]